MLPELWALSAQVCLCIRARIACLFTSDVEPGAWEQVACTARALIALEHLQLRCGGSAAWRARGACDRQHSCAQSPRCQRRAAAAPDTTAASYRAGYELPRVRTVRLRPLQPSMVALLGVCW